MMGLWGVKLEGLLARHVARHARVAERLRLHDALHVGRPPELASNKHARRVGNAVRDDDLLDLLAKGVLDRLGEVVELRRLGLALLLLLLGLLELEALLGHAHELLAVELLELRDGVLVDGVDEQQDLEALLLEHLEEGRVADGGEGLAGEVVDRLLNLGHAGDVV